MSHQQPGQESSDTSAEQECSPPFMTDCHRVALERLGRAFEERRPLSIMIGEGKSDAGFIIREFLQGIDDDVVVARITEPCTDAIDGMRKIIDGIGFDPKDMNLADLENVFRMFLIFQRTHRRRTLICFEETQDCGQWVLDRVRHLVELELKGKFGLMVVLAGRSGLNKLLYKPPLDGICATAGQRIVLAPFTIAETKEYVRCRVESAGTAEIGQMFEFDTIAAIHELTAGVPDTVSKLCSKCLELAEEESTIPVNMDLVKKAAELLCLPDTEQQPDVEEETESEPVPVTDSRPRRGQLTAIADGETAQVLTLERGHILIGRDDLCDIHLDRSPVSRHHALIVNSERGVTVIDLGSTNGTYLNGRQIKQRRLHDGDELAVGDCRIEYIAGDEHYAWDGDIEPTERFAPNITDLGTSEKGKGRAAASSDSGKTAVLRGLNRAFK